MKKFWKNKGWINKKFWPVDGLTVVAWLNTETLGTQFYKKFVKWTLLSTLFNFFSKQKNNFSCLSFFLVKSWVEIKSLPDVRTTFGCF